MNRVVFSAVALLSFVLQSAPPAALPALPQTTPAAVGMDAAKLVDAVALYRDAVQRDDIRGAVLFVARRGRVVLHSAVGWKHHAYKLPMANDTIFRMASNTKAPVAAAILMLADDGKLTLTDAAAKYLKSFDNDKSRGITIEQLLTHSSGFRIGPIFYPFEQGEEPTLQAAVAKFGKEGPAAAPGTYSYSNPGYNTLGAIIEAASGMALEAFLKSRLYDPLGMADSLNHEDPSKLQRMATVYRGRRAAGKVEFTQGFTPGDPPDYPVIRASGGMISTASDFARFLEMYRLGGAYAGRRILKETTARSAVTGRVPFGQNQAKYGYGWMIAADGTYSHAGSDGTMAWIDPAHEIVGMVLTQSPGGNNPTEQFRRLVTEAVK